MYVDSWAQRSVDGETLSPLAIFGYQTYIGYHCIISTLDSRHLMMVTFPMLGV